MRREQADMAVGNAKGPALELCCGPGGLTVELATRFKYVLGVDLCPEMLACAKKRLKKRGLKNVTLMECEVSKLLFPDDSFASISISLGLHELPNWIKEPLLKKSIRWLKPGGRYVVCDYRNHDTRFGRFIFRTFARTFIEPKLYDEHMEFDIHSSMKAMGLTRVALNRSFFSYFEMCAWSLVPHSHA
jgi:ubiquinone/menaquinone biosynthesis C-methylase UbiE